MQSPKSTGIRVKCSMLVKASLALALFFLVAQSALAQQQWSVGYYTPNGFAGKPWLPPSAIEWGGVTHVIYWGGVVHSDGTLDLTTQQVTTDGPILISNAHANGVKVLLGLFQANWLSGGSNTFQPAITNNLSGFVANIMSAVNSYGFDGVDIDWEPFSAGTNGSALTSLSAALRTALGTRILTASFGWDSYPWAIANSSYFDRISVQTYDGSNPAFNTYSWYNAALIGPNNNSNLSVDYIASLWTGQGFPAAKLLIGIPFYGYVWTGGGITGPRQNWTTTPSVVQTYYQSLASLITSSNYNWDTSAQVPYLSINTGNTSTDQFITYDDAQSVAAKVNYAKSKALGGWIIWELVGDYFPTQTPTQPLLDAIKNAMGPAAVSITTTSLPSATQSTAYSTTLTASGGTTPYTWSIASGTLPAGLALAAASGTISGVPTTTGTSNFTVKVADATSLTATQALSITVNATTATATITITPTSLPYAIQNSAYSATLTAAGGTAPYSWSIASGTLPSGLALASSTGVISGTPTTTGTSSFTVKATDATSLTATQALSITVLTSSPFALWKLDETSGSIASDSSGNNNTATLLNSPAWLSGANCMIYGCLSFNGTNQSGTATLNLSDTNVITVAFWLYWNAYSSNDALAMEFTSNFNLATTGFMIDPNSSQSGGTQFEAGIRGDAGYNQVLFARPSAGAWHYYAFVFNKGAAAASQVTPYVDGVAVPYTKSTSAANSNNFGADSFYFMSRATSILFGAGRMDDVRIYKRVLSASEILTLANDPPPSITTTSLPSGTQSTAYSATLTATSGTTPYTWSLASGTLPSGLTLASATGVISGTPTATGTSNFTVTVTDATSLTASQALSISVNAPASSNLSITTTSLPSGTRNKAYSATLAATGGTTPYIWSIASGALPSGLTLSSATGVISGTPTASGTSNFTVTVTDATSVTASQALSITVRRK